MCTAISYSNGSHYFGRNLDLEHWFCETVTITPRNFPFSFHSAPNLPTHNAIIGMASIVDNYPLYYDATNELGLSMAGLNFPGNATYFSPQSSKLNLAPYELIPWFLGKYASIAELADDLSKLNISNTQFNTELPMSPLHWLISDSRSSIVLESTADGLHIYENPIAVLTNNPPFPYHLHNLSNYLNLTACEPENRFASDLNLTVFSRGMGAIGLPGDLSSASRFIRAAFTLHNSVAETNEESSISQFFHILGSVTQQSGCVKVKDAYEKTLYSSCCNTDKGIYYYKTYDNSAVTAVRMHSCNLESKSLHTYPIRKRPTIIYEN
jgi:choloylglycine hydrolase